jgi:2-methylcitrate dehydratase PrpD
VEASGWHGGATRELAAFVAGTRYPNLPSSASDRIKALVLDTLGVAAAGSTQRAPQRVAEFTRRYGGSPISTVIGMPFRTDPASAALVNGTSAHVLDYDDVSFAASAHPSVSLLPAILALAEEERASGPEVICAYAVGFEAAVLVGRTINPEHYAHGWHGTGTVGALAATFAAANLLGLDESGVLAAIGIAVAGATGIRQNFGTDVKPLHAGNAGRVGVTAARMAQHGLSGHPQILEGDLGFFNVFGPGPARNHARPPGPLGDPWAVLDPGITTKIFPSCASTHNSVDLILGLRDIEGLCSRDVDLIEVTLRPISAGNLRYPRPHTGLEAKFSLPYCVSRALLDGTLLLEHFTDEAITDGRVAALSEKVIMHVDPALGPETAWGAQRPAVVRVHTTAGGVLERDTFDQPPRPDIPRGRLLAKFVDCLGRGGLDLDADRIIAATDDLESCSDVTELTRLLGDPSSTESPEQPIANLSRS